MDWFHLTIVAILYVVAASLGTIACYVLTGFEGYHNLLGAMAGVVLFHKSFRSTPQTP